MKKGFGLDLFKFSRCLSVAGICVSIVGVIGGIANLVIIASSEDIAFTHFPKLFYGAGAVILIFTMLYLAMWIQLKIKTSKRDVPGIEKIGDIYSFVTGVQEIIGSVSYIGLGLFKILQKEDVKIEVYLSSTDSFMSKAIIGIFKMHSFTNFCASSISHH